MGISIEDCLKLPSLYEAELVAGIQGINNIVKSVSVLEWVDNNAYKTRHYGESEIVITSFFTIKDDITTQCNTIELLYEAGCAGLILYYVGIIMPSIKPELIQIADKLNFPLICMPLNQINYRYSEVIAEIMDAIFQSKINKSHYDKRIIKEILKLPLLQRTIDNILNILSERLRLTIILTDMEFDGLRSSIWPISSSLNLREILDQYKNDLIAMIDANQIEIKYNGEIMSVKCIPIKYDYNQNMNLILLKKGGHITYNQIQEAVSTIEFSSTIWNLDVYQAGPDELISALISNDFLKIRQIGKSLDISTSKIHTMWVFINKDSTSSPKDNLLVNKALTTVKNFLEELRIKAVTGIFKNNIITFIYSESIEDNNLTANAIIEGLKINKLGNLKLISCPDITTTNQINSLYSKIIAGFDYVSQIYPYKDIISIEEIKFACECKKIIEEGKESIGYNIEILSPLKDSNDQIAKDLIITLETYLLDTQLNLAETSKLLYIHQNTARYRIKRIEELFKYDILKLPEVIKIYKAVAINRILRNMDNEFCTKEIHP